MIAPLPKPLFPLLPSSAITKLGQVPRGQKITALLEHDGLLYVATDRCIYVLKAKRKRKKPDAAR